MMTQSDEAIQYLLGLVLPQKQYQERLCRDLGFVQKPSNKIYTESLHWYATYKHWDESTREYYRETRQALLKWHGAHAEITSYLPSSLWPLLGSYLR